MARSRIPRRTPAKVLVGLLVFLTLCEIRSVVAVAQRVAGRRVTWPVHPICDELAQVAASLVFGRPRSSELWNSSLRWLTCDTRSIALWTRRSSTLFLRSSCIGRELEVQEHE